MFLKIRILLVVALVLAALGVFGWARWKRTTPREVATASEAAWDHTRCRECHAEVWREWETSFHSRAWADPNVQAAFQHFGNDRKCQSCHAPQPVLLAGLDVPPELRQEDPDSGVNCLSCHLLPEGGGVAARRTIADAPCRPVGRLELTESRLCGVCHESIYDDWQKSTYADEPKTCHDCHMPKAPDRRSGRSHLCLGGHDAETVRRGAVMECRREGDELVVAVTNHATGHNFPGERHQRTLHVEVVETDAEGRVVLARQVLIKGVTAFRGESTSDDIAAGETFEARFPVVEDSAAAAVRLLYKAFPWYTDREALIVHRDELHLE